MKNIAYLFVLICTIVSLILWYYIFKKSYNQKRLEPKNPMFDSWKIGDLIVLDEEQIERTKTEYSSNSGILRGWNEKFIYLFNPHDNTINEISIKCLKYNKTVYWNKRYNECKKIMNMPPDFSIDINPMNVSVNIINKDTSEDNSILNNKSVENLTETECEIFLKIAIEQEDYLLAEKIRKQMEKYR